jgi:hypothetical protein
MAAPLKEIVQMEYQNPHAARPLFLPVLVISNTSDEDLARNVRINAARDLEWVTASEAHDRVAVVVGGGPSLADTLDDIRKLQKEGATIFAANAASAFLSDRGIAVDYQVMVDAKAETAILVDPKAGEYLLASQCHPATFEAAAGPTRVWHLATENVEGNFPAERVSRGGYALIGGGAAVGNSALCLAFAMGYRDLHIFGFDSCHRDGASHAYDQPMNQFIPCVDVKWGGKTYTASVAMKAQAERFQIVARDLRDQGCKLSLYGDGLLQAMYLTPPKDLSEREKYTLMWQTDSYRRLSPGEEAVDTFLEVMNPDGLIIDFGCGTGRAGVALSRAGHDVFLIDFTDNCRDEKALSLPFLEWDLTRPCPMSAGFGMCADVMEHIPPEDVETVIVNIMAASEKTFFQISTVADHWGALIDQPLHLTVKPHDWWLGLFGYLGYDVVWARDIGIASQFVVCRPRTDT